MTEKDIEEFREKLKDLENSIRDFQNKHTDQVNNLIELFSDVLEIIKDKDKDIEEEKTQELAEPKIANNEFIGKTPKEIVDYIMSISNFEEEQSEEIEKEKKDIDFDALKMELDFKNDDKVKTTFKIEKSVSPVKEWVDAFKKTDKYLNIKNI